ncbi:MAG: PEP-CTERM sorting domain-containing protein [Congregibacter sp.]
MNLSPRVAPQAHTRSMDCVRSGLACAVVLLLSVSLAAEARLSRGGGRGANTIISDITLAGTVPFLVEENEGESEEGSPLLGSDGSLTGLDLSSAAAYGYGPIGFAASVSHDWGRDCALNTECFFELGASDVLQWQGHIVGLPEELIGGDTYDAVADLRVTWELLAVEELPPGVFSTGPRPSRPLGPDFIWSSLFSASSDGSYAPGFGSPSVMLGESLGYLPAADEFSGCFAPFPAGPPVLPLAEAYSRGDCREVSLDLAQETSAPTGAELRAQLAADEYLAMMISIEFIAPEGFQFANLFEAGGPLPIDAILPGAAGLPTPDSLRALDSVEYRGCAGGADSNCDGFGWSSQAMRITVVDNASATSVPAPATLWLLFAGVLGCGSLRRGKKRIPGA